MVDIDAILNMLDDRNPPEMQERGIELTDTISALNVLVMPFGGACGPHLWENCAKAICKRSDRTLCRYGYNLLPWLRDMSYPGAQRIRQRLLRIGDKRQIEWALRMQLQNARAAGDEQWLMALNELQKACDAEKEQKTCRSIDELYEMLSWNQPEEIQQRAIEEAGTVKNLYLFLQPCGKDIWENCAEVLFRHTDEELEPYLEGMFHWLIDLNWPGAERIQERLRQYTDKAQLHRLAGQIDQKYARADKKDRWEIDSMLAWLREVL